MAQQAAASARAARQPRPPAPRVVPAIPHSLTKKPRTAPSARKKPVPPDSNPVARPPEPDQQLPSTPTILANHTDVDEVNGVATPTASYRGHQPQSLSTQPPSSVESATIEDESGDHKHTVSRRITPVPQADPREPPPAFRSAAQASSLIPTMSDSGHHEPSFARPSPTVGNGSRFDGMRNPGSITPAPAARGGSFAQGNDTPFTIPHGPSTTVFAPNGHAHHVSEPFAGPSYHPLYLQTHPPGLGPPQGAPNFYTHYHPSFQGPRSAGVIPSQHSQYVHQSPSIQNGSQGRPSEAFSSSTNHQQAASRPFPASNDPISQMPVADDNAFSLAQYLRSQFGNKDFADHIVSIAHTGHQLSPGALACHGVILARSPKLRSLMAMQSSGPSSFPKDLALVISDRFISHDAVVPKCISHLYGDVLADHPFIVNVASVTQTDRSLEWECLRLALSYAAMGHFLQVGPLVTRGIGLAGAFLDWTNIPLALAFALEGGLGASWSQIEVVADERDGSSSFDDTKSESPTSAPMYGIYSDRLLHSVIQFLLERTPNDFRLLTSVAQLPQTPRLPNVAEPRHARTGSRLSQIRFGEMTVESEPSDPVRETLSSILLSLPLVLLKHFLEHPLLIDRLGTAKVAEVMRDVIDEREKRRQRVQKSLPPDSINSALEERHWHTVRWAELIEPVQQQQLPSCGFRIVRQRTGIETPPSSTTAKT